MPRAVRAEGREGYGQALVALQHGADLAVQGARNVSAGSLSGTVTDSSGAAIPDAVVTVFRNAETSPRQVLSGADGSFVLPGLPAGGYRLRITETGFAPWSGAAMLAEGQTVTLAEIILTPRADASTVEVHASGREIAEAQMELEEHQRVLGIFPNFYASYAGDPEPLSAAQKLRLAWRFSNDPVAFAMAGVIAGAQQGGGSFSGYGGGPQGFSRRVGATYTDGLTSTMLGQALLPILFHQDPRYFVKGTGSLPSRTLYALASTVMCKGDDRRWQVNYSNIVGNLMSAGLSNAYYPTSQRGAALLVQNGLTSTALGAVGGLFQEFLLRRMTPHPNGE